MDLSNIKPQLVNLKRSRNNLLLMAVLMAINVVLFTTSVNYYLLISPALPMLFETAAETLAFNLQIPALGILGIVCSLLVVALYLVCWLLSKRRRAFLLVAFIPFFIDFLAFAYVVLVSRFNPALTLDIIFHAYFLYQLYIGVRAWSKLRDASPEMIAAAQLQLSVPVRRTPVRAPKKFSEIIAAGKRNETNANDETVNLKALNSEALNSETLNSETLNSETLNSEALNNSDATETNEAVNNI